MMGTNDTEYNTSILSLMTRVSLNTLKCLIKHRIALRVPGKYFLDRNSTELLFLRQRLLKV